MRIRIPGLLVVSLMLAGCGGGSNTTTTPPPLAPTVTATTPANAAVGVTVTSAVTATFSVAMNAGTITSSTFTLTPQGGAAVSTTVTYASSIATLTPSSPLANGTQYTATITTGAANSSGTALAANYSWTFTTAAAAPAPTVTAVTPTNASTGVAITSAVTATFSAAMNAATITSSTFTLTPQGGTAVSAVASYASSVATLTPNSPLTYNTQYTATITTGAQSSQGIALAASYTWTFTTATAPPPPVPTVTAVTPAIAATGVAVASAITATFSQPMNSASLTGSTFTLTGPGGAVGGAVSYSSATQTASFDPTVSLAYGATYAATITTGATSSAGEALAANYTWSFTTVQAPTVAATQPANGAVGVSLSQVLTATFSQQMNSSTITASTFTLAGPGSTAVAGLVSYNSTTAVATFTLNSALTGGTTYTATITTGATSAGGVPLATNYVWTFTTAANPNQVTVDFGTTFQTIRGFGGSTAWLGQMPQAVATALFSPTNGLGLGMLRVRIDPEGSATGGGAHGDPYETGEWDYEAANGAEAVAANPKAIVFATPWTPPATWKLNGTTTTVSGTTFNEAFNATCGEGAGYCGGYLNPTNYGGYATYLEDFVSFFNTTNSFNLYAISMQNEPEENVTYESSVWTPQQMDTWIAGNASTITSDKYSTKLIMPESDTFNPIDAATALSDPNAQGLISIIGGHIYGVQPTPFSIPAGDSPKEIWMTEFGPLSTATLTWSEALTTYGESIHNSMVTGQYNAYVWWGLFGASSGSCATSAGTCGLVDNAGNVMPMGNVMGQYSKFIAPGSVRVLATASPVSGVFVSAYSSSSPSHYAIVVINANTTSESLSFTLNNGSVTSLTPYESTSAGGLMPQTAVSVAGGQFSYTLPAQSIVTFVQ